jgi:hypothetical protein
MIPPFWRPELRHLVPRVRQAGWASVDPLRSHDCSERVSVARYVWQRLPKKSWGIFQPRLCRRPNSLGFVRPSMRPGSSTRHHRSPENCIIAPTTMGVSWRWSPCLLRSWFIRQHCVAAGVCDRAVRRTCDKLAIATRQTMRAPVVACKQCNHHAGTPRIRPGK